MAPNGRPGGLMCMSRGTFNGTERTTSPWAFSTPCCAAFERKCLSLTHALVGTFLCVVSGVLPHYWNQYLGHLGPAAVMFVLSELERYPGPATVVAQGWTAIIGGASYLTYDLLIHGCGLNIFCHGHREQHHIAINTLFILVGVDMVLQRSRFSASLVGIGFGLFVWLHPQPNDMGILVHKFAGVMLALYAVARMCSRFDLCHKALYYAAYLFFYGQNGFMDMYGGAPSVGTLGVDGYNAGTPPVIDATAYVLFVLSLATAMQTATETLDGRCFGGQAGMMMSTTGGGGGGVGGGSPGKARLGQFDEFETVRLTDACFDDLEARDRNRRGD